MLANNPALVWLSDPANVQGLLPSKIRLDKLLAHGGQGVVHQGWVSQENAAIKIYLPGQLHTRIEREVDALRKIISPSVVKLLWYGSIPYGTYQLPVVATSLVPGEPLTAMIARGAISHSTMDHIAFDIADAIDSIWQHRIVHRDIKPSNILVQPNGQACVIDLGIARHLDKSTLTALGFTGGTVGYLSPEQCKAARSLTCKSDVYALGVILLECAMGRHPTNLDQQQLVNSKFHLSLPLEARQWNHARLLRDMLHENPANRPKPRRIKQVLSQNSP